MGALQPHHGNTGALQPHHGHMGALQLRHGHMGVLQPRHGHMGVLQPHHGHKDALQPVSPRGITDTWARARSHSHSSCGHMGALQPRQLQSHGCATATAAAVTWVRYSHGSCGHMGALQPRHLRSQKSAHCHSRASYLILWGRPPPPLPRPATLRRHYWHYCHTKPPPHLPATHSTGTYTYPMTINAKTFTPPKTLPATPTTGTRRLGQVRGRGANKKSAMGDG